MARLVLLQSISDDLEKAYIRKVKAILQANDNNWWCESKSDLYEYLRGEQSRYEAAEYILKSEDTFQNVYLFIFATKHELEAMQRDNLVRFINEIIGWKVQNGKTIVYLVIPGDFSPADIERQINTVLTIGSVEVDVNIPEFYDVSEHVVRLIRKE